MDGDVGFSTYALVERFGSNVATVVVWPADRLDQVINAAACAGLELSAAGEAGNRAALYFQPEDFGDDTLGRLADTLTRCGVGTYAYALQHGDSLDDRHIDVFTRAGHCSPLRGNRVVFVQVHQLSTDDGAPSLMTTVFGAPDDLEALLPALAQRFVPEPCEAADGTLASILIRHEEAALGEGAEQTVIDDLCDLLADAGMDSRVTIERA